MKNIVENAVEDFKMLFEATKAEAYWISPKGAVIPVQDRHIDTVIDNPEKFGTTLNKIKKKYVSVWADNFMSGFMLSEGTCDDSGKVITFHGEYSDPMTGKTQKDKAVFRIINNDKHVFEMYGTTPDGKEFLSLEITYTRR